MATDLELFVNPEAYASRISMLEGYVVSLQSIKEEYVVLSNDASTVFGTDDENLARAQKIVNDAAQVVQQKIEATQASIDTLQKTMESMNAASESVGNILTNTGELISALLD